MRGEKRPNTASFVQSSRTRFWLLRIAPKIDFILSPFRICRSVRLLVSGWRERRHLLWSDFGLGTILEHNLSKAPVNKRCHLFLPRSRPIAKMMRRFSIANKIRNLLIVKHRNANLYFVVSKSHDGTIVRQLDCWWLWYRSNTVGCFRIIISLAKSK